MGSEGKGPEAGAACNGTERDPAPSPVLPSVDRSPTGVKSVSIAVIMFRRPQRRLPEGHERPVDTSDCNAGCSNPFPVRDEGVVRQRDFLAANSWLRFPRGSSKPTRRITVARTGHPAWVPTPESRRLEVRAGIEPAYADLQSDASPLCHRTPGAEPIKRGRPTLASPGRGHPVRTIPDSHSRSVAAEAQPVCRVGGPSPGGTQPKPADYAHSAVSGKPAYAKNSRLAFAARALYMTENPDRMRR